MTAAGVGPIRLVYMIDSLGPGGAEQTLKGILEFIDRDRFDTRVAVLQDRQGNPLAGSIRELGIPVDEIGVPRLRSPGGHGRVLGYLHEHRPQVIHTHLEFSHTLGGIYGRALGARPIATVHVFARGQTGLKGRRLALMWWSLRRSHVEVIAPSTAALEYVHSHGRIPDTKLRVVHNGVDVSRFRPRPGRRGSVRADLGIPGDATVLVTVAVLRQGKGIGDLIAAMAEISRSVPDVFAVVVGEGEMRPDLERRAQELGVAARVLFTGRREDVPDLLGMSDVFVLPTHQDVLPTVVAEAMAVGLPVISTNVGGLTDMVDNDVTGLLYPAGDVDALTGHCIMLLQNISKREEMGAMGRRRAEERFNLEAQVQELETLYLKSLMR